MSAVALRAALVAHTPLTALVSTRIVSDRAEQTMQRPFCAFELEAVEYITALADVNEIFSQTFRVACFADDRLKADQVADAVEAALQAVGQKVTGRVNDLIPELDIHVTEIQVLWID
jgi:Protein of unknown function (DUF3168)